MIRRFLYHAFWNFYDYIGTYVLSGILVAFVMAGIGSVVLQVLSALSVLWVQLAITGVAIAITVVLFTLIVAAYNGFSARVAKGDPARWHHLWQNALGRFWPTFKLLALGSLLLAICVSNILFYRHLAYGNAVGGKAIWSVMPVIFAYFSVLVFAFFAIACAAVGFSEIPLTLPYLLRQTLVRVVLLPSLWFFLIGCSAAFVVTALVLPPLLVFLGILALPLGSCAFATAYWLADQYVEFLIQAREELGPGHPLRHYRKRAMELGWEWEHRQPMRTLKELFKPWEQ